MKNFLRANAAGALFCLAVTFSAFSANAQTPSDATAVPPNSEIVSPQPTEPVPPVTVQDPTPVAAAPAQAPTVPAPANVPPPSDGIKMNPNAEPAAAEPAKPAKHAKAKKTVHHKAAKHHAKKKSSKHAKAKKKAAVSSAREHVRTAQTNLETLGYTPGPIDGLTGPKTRAAVKAFQKDHQMKVTGKLDDKTFERISAEATAALNKKKMAEPAPIVNGGEVGQAQQPPPEFFAKHPDYYGHYNDAYANPLQMGSPQVIPTRYGDMQIADQSSGGMHQYVVTLNGQPIFHADGQPSVINLSRTFNLDSADAIVLTSYAAGDNMCAYRHYLLVVRLNSSGVHEIGNCTRAYEAYTQQGSLYITFPGQHTDGWSSGDTWRYEHGTLQRF